LVKVVQLRSKGHKTEAVGFGNSYFPREAMAEGVVVKPEEMAKAVRPVLEKVNNGKISAKRVVTSIPASKVFTRTLQLPIMNDADLKQAINYEVEQYVPVPVAELYIDYDVVSRTNGEEGHMDILMMAVPRTIVDSYIKMFEYLNLEIGAIESDMTAVTRALLHSGDAGDSTLIMNIGSLTSDLTIFDKFTPLTGTVPVGGEQFTNALVQKLGVKADEAKEIKIKFGIGPSGLQDKVFPALEADLQAAVKEAKRVIKYYESHDDKQQQHVESMAICGGTAQMPGIAEYFQKEVGLPLKVANPWKNLELKKSFSQPKEAPMYTTAIGLALRGLS